MPAIFVDGDILDQNVDYIAHQTNCISAGSSGLARAIFDKYPESNLYQERASGNYFHKPGHIYLRKTSGPTIINMMAQFAPGITPFNVKLSDIQFTETSELRMVWFLSCLDKMCLLNGSSIAFPYKIGCGLAGGNWDSYKKAIDDFADSCGKIVFIVKRPGDV